MKALVIIGSPRKKNCYQFSKNIEEETNKGIKCEFEYLFLKEVNLEYCRGCGFCLNDEKKCPINDDFKIILGKIKTCNLIIISSPVYSYHESALIKNFFDRFHYLHFRPEFFNVFAINLILSNYSGIKEVIKYLNFTARSWGFQVISNIGISSYLYGKNPNYKNNIDQKITESVLKFIKYKTSDIRLKPSFYDLLLYKDKKKLVKRYKSKYSETYNYWEKNNYIKSNYYNKVYINPLYKLFLVFKNLDLSRS